VIRFRDDDWLNQSSSFEAANKRGGVFGKDIESPSM